MKYIKSRLGAFYRGALEKAKKVTEAVKRPMGAIRFAVDFICAAFQTALGLAYTVATTAAVLTLLFIAYLALGMIAPVPFEASNIKEPAGLRYRTVVRPTGLWAGTKDQVYIWSFRIENEGLVKVAKSRLSNDTYYQVPLIGWVKSSS